MPQRSAINDLPADVRSELERRLLRNGFSQYRELAEWLQEAGFEITKSSVQRFGKPFEERMRALKIATDQAKALAAEAGDDEGAMNEALIRLVQTKAFEILLALQENGEHADLSKIGRMVAELARASVTQKKWAVEARKKALSEAANAVGEAALARGFDEKEAAFWREKVLGVG